jgi:cyclic pyranopterin phosphate synthase
MFCELGGEFIKLTGGDPSLWEPIVPTVAGLKKMPGLRGVEVISRHPRIGTLASPLVNAGADVINISIDTLRADRHHQITGINDLDAVLEAARVCSKSGAKCKINTVVMRGVNDDELEDLVTFCEQNKIASIKFLDVIGDIDAGTESFAQRLRVVGREAVDSLYVPLQGFVDQFRTRAVRSFIAGQGGLGHPMIVLVLESGLQLIFKDHLAGAWYGSICQGCRHYPCHDALMALRVSADLRLQFCLLGDEFSIDLRPSLEAGPRSVCNTIAAALDVYDHAAFRGPSTPFNTRIGA